MHQNETGFHRKKLDAVMRLYFSKMFNLGMESTVPNSAFEWSLLYKLVSYNSLLVNSVTHLNLNAHLNWTRRLQKNRIQKP